MTSNGRMEHASIRVVEVKELFVETLALPPEPGGTHKDRWSHQYLSPLQGRSLFFAIDVEWLSSIARKTKAPSSRLKGLS